MQLASITAHSPPEKIYMNGHIYELKICRGVYYYICKICKEGMGGNVCAGNEDGDKESSDEESSDEESSDEESSNEGGSSEGGSDKAEEEDAGSGMEDEDSDGSGGGEGLHSDSGAEAPAHATPAGSNTTAQTGAPPQAATVMATHEVIYISSDSEDDATPAASNTAAQSDHARTTNAGRAARQRPGPSTATTTSGRDVMAIWDSDSDDGGLVGLGKRGRESAGESKQKRRRV